MGLLDFLRRLANRPESGVRNETSIYGDVTHTITGGSFRGSSIKFGPSAKSLTNILKEQQADKEIAENRAMVTERKDRFDRMKSISPENPWVSGPIKITGVASWMLGMHARDYAVAQTALGRALLDKAMSAGYRRGPPCIKEAEALFRDALQLLDREQYPDDWRVTQALLGYASESLALLRSEGSSFSDAIVAYRAAMELCDAAKDHDEVAFLQARIADCEQKIKVSG